MDLHQFDLKPLRLKDRPFIDSILSSSETMLSSYAFVSHYIWRDIFHFYWGIINHYFCLFAQYDNYIYMPIPPVLSNLHFSKGGKQKIISTVFSMMEKINNNKTVSRIENIDDCQVSFFTSHNYDIKPGESEYLYLREELANLKGDPYKSKRAMCNYFVKHYQYSYETFQASSIVDCISLFDYWNIERGKKINDPFYHALLDDSSLAHKQAMRHYKSLQFTGRIIRINGKVEGYTFGFALGNIFYILLEVANPDIRGLAQFIFREFCSEMNGYTYINTLGDSGLENLRRVKLSYKPYKVIPSYIAYQNL